MQTQVDLAEENLILRQENACLKEELAQLRRLIFGSKKERFIPSDSAQTSLFDEPEETIEPEVEQIAYTREKSSKKGKAKRLLLPAHLPRKEEIIEPEDLVENSVRIGEKVTEVLEYTPGKFYVTKTVRPVYKQKTGKIQVAELPTQVIPNGNAGASILAYLLVSKFIDHLPFYRQVQIFKRDGMKIAESTISGWFRKTCRLLEPLYELMVRKISDSDYIQADESPIPVLSAQKPGSTHKGYQWVFLLPKSQMVIFQYHQSRGKEVPKKVLKSFQGCLQTDGYAGYDQLGKHQDITHIGCMAHARRKFDAAKENDMESASYALELFQRLYGIERKAKEEKLSAEQIVEMRTEQAVPILNELKEWLDKKYAEVLPKSAIGKAVSYALSRWSYLIRYTQNGEWKIDNNEVENKIRPLALGRKNYLFAGSHDAAQQAAMMYSFFGTCKLNGIEPLEWLTQTLKRISDHPVNQLHELLPLKKQENT